MRVRFCGFALVILMLGGSGVPNVSAQEPPAPPETPAAPAPAAPQPPEPPAQPVPPARAVRPLRPPAEPSRAADKGVNIRVDATVSESRGTEVIAKKVLSVTVVDGENGSVRSMIRVPQQQGKTPETFSYVQAPLNMDVRAMLRDDNRVRVALTLDYNGGRLGTGESEWPVPIDNGIRQAVTVVLENGKPMVVAQSADAIGDRRVTLEVKATVLK